MRIFILMIFMIQSARAEFDHSFNTQYQEYMKAAESAEEAADAHDILWKVWAGVGGVCTGICMASKAYPFLGTLAGGAVCSVPMLGASVYDAVKTKEFTSALVGIVGTAASVATPLMLSGATSTVTTNAQGTTTQLTTTSVTSNGTTTVTLDGGTSTTATQSQTNWGACLAAAMAFANAYMKNSAMQEERESADENKKLAARLKSEMNRAASTQVLAVTPRTAAVNSVTYGEGGVSAGTDSAVSGKGAESSSSGNGGCSNALSSGSTSGAIQCALAHDSTFPPVLTHPNFQEAFKKTSGGMDFSTFLSQKSNSPTHAITRAMGGLLSSDQAVAMTSTLEKYRSALLAPAVQGVQYAGVGVGANNNKKSQNQGSENTLENMMKNLHDPANAPHFNLDTISYAYQTRTPAAIEADTQLNIFERVTYRYQHVYRKLLLE